MLMSRHQNAAEQDVPIQTANKSFKNAKKTEHFSNVIKKHIHEEIKSRVQLGEFLKGNSEYLVFPSPC